MGKKLLVLSLVLLFAGWMAVALTNGAVLWSFRETLSGWFEPKPERFSGEVDARTDATEYHAGEEIGVSVTNRLETPVRTHIGSSTPLASVLYAERKYSDGSWHREEVMCRPPHCTYMVDSPYALEPGKTRSFRWKPVFFRDGTTEQRPAPAGIYRLVLRYQVKPDPAIPDWVWHQTVTNPFTIH